MEMYLVRGIGDWELGIWEAGDGEEHSVMKPRDATVVNSGKCY